jgi:flagellar hook assembly protein FlgD
MDRSGGNQFYGPVEATAVALVRDRLAQNSPNPFYAGTGSTAISFELTNRTHARLQVFDATGRNVRLIVDEALEPGEHTSFWDGRNDRGERVSSGIYFYRLDAGEFSDTRSLVQLR